MVAAVGRARIVGAQLLRVWDAFDSLENFRTTKIGSGHFAVFIQGADSTAATNTFTRVKLIFNLRKKI